MSKQGFKECYLVPRHLYDAFMQDKRANVISGLPDDVKIKIQDFNKRFNLAGEDLQQQDDGVEDYGKHEIISSVSDYSKRKKAEDIVDFILNNSAGVIKWDRNFNIILDDQRLFGTDIRDLVRHLVGDTKGELDANQTKVVSRLKQINVLPHRLISQLQSWEPISSVLEEEAPTTYDSDLTYDDSEKEYESAAEEEEDWDSEFRQEESGAATPPDSEKSKSVDGGTQKKTSLRSLLSSTENDPGGDADHSKKTKKISILDSSSEEEEEEKKKKKKKKGRTHSMVTRGEKKRKKTWMNFPS